MSVKSFLEDLGTKAKDVFAWLGSSQGQATITATEGAAVGVATAVGGPGAGAAVAGVEALINAGLKQVISVETVAAAAGAQNGTGAQKAAAVTTAVAPQIQALLQSLGVPSPTASQIQSVGSALSTGLVGIMNSLPAPAAE